SLFHTSWGDPFLPPIPALLAQPFWLDPSDRHHMAAAMQAEARPLAHEYTAASGDLPHDEVFNERIWAKAVHRVAAEGISPRAGDRRGDRPHQADPERIDHMTVTVGMS